MARSLQWTETVQPSLEQRGRGLHYVRVSHPPAVHVQVHALGLLEAAEVGCHLGLFHGLALQIGQALDQLDALVVLAADEGLLGSLQVQLLQGGLSQQTPERFTSRGTKK